MGQSALAGADRLGQRDLGRRQYVFGGINSADAPLADYYLDPASAAKRGGRPGVSDGVRRRCRPITAAANITASADAELSFRAVRGAVHGQPGPRTGPRRRATNTSAEIAPGQTVTTSTNANSAGLSEPRRRPTRCSRRSADLAQRRGAAGRRLRGDVARSRRARLAHQRAGRARRDAVRRSPTPTAP